MRKFKAVVVLLLCFALMLPTVAWADEPGNVATINFDGTNITFPQGNDLFLNYKNIMPGNELTQSMRLVNDSSKKTSFYLKMKIAEQEELSEAELARVQELLFNSDLMSLKIVADGTTLYDDKAGGRRILSLNDENVGKYTTFETDTDEVSASIPLGTLSKKSQADFEVILTVAPTMGNEYAKLVANVDWEFQVNAYSSSIPPVPPIPEEEEKPKPEEEPKPTPKPPVEPEKPTPTEPTVEPTPEEPEEQLPPPVFPNEVPVPETGDDFPILLCGAIVIFSAVMIVVLTKLYRKLNA